MEQQNNLCAQLAEMLGGSGMQVGSVCMVMKDRTNVSATIANHPMHSIHHMFHLEGQDNNGNALITGEIVLLEDEVPKTVDRISSTGIIVSAIHNHWLYDNPKLIYIHIETYTNPITFAKMIAPILNDLK